MTLAEKKIVELLNKIWSELLFTQGLVWLVAAFVLRDAHPTFGWVCYGLAGLRILRSALVVVKWS